MSGVGVAVQTAIFQRMAGGGLTALGGGACGVHGFVPPNTAYPYVTMDRFIGQDADTIGDTVTTWQAYLVIWSAYAGHLEAQHIADALHALFHEKPITLATGEAITCRVDRRDIVRDADGITYMGNITLSLETQH